MEAALSWLQFPQQDADNIEKKPKVHLAVEMQKGQGQGMAPVGNLGAGTLWEQETPNP